jgi:hypothetical protein
MNWHVPKSPWFAQAKKQIIGFNHMVITNEQSHGARAHQYADTSDAFHQSL